MFVFVLKALTWCGDCVAREVMQMGTEDRREPTRMEAGALAAELLMRRRGNRNSLGVENGVT